MPTTDFFTRRIQLAAPVGCGSLPRHAGCTIGSPVTLAITYSPVPSPGLCKRVKRRLGSWRKNHLPG